MTDERLNNPTDPTQAAVHEILRQLIQQNNMRDQQVLNILENIASQRAQTVSQLGTIPKFLTPTEKGEFERMVFELINAPYEFSRLMKKIMQYLERNVAMWYLDDILIPAISFEEMMISLRIVFDALRPANLTLKLEKCHFGYEVTYLGYRLSAHGIKPGNDKAAAILKLKHPTNRHEVRRSLGLTGFFRRFVPQYAQIAKQLTKYTVPYEWGCLQQEAFDTKGKNH